MPNQISNNNPNDLFELLLLAVISFYIIGRVAVSFIFGI